MGNPLMDFIFPKPTVSFLKEIFLPCSIKPACPAMKTKIVVHVLSFLALMSFLTIQPGCNKQDSIDALPVQLLTNLSEGDAFECGDTIQLCIDIEGVDRITRVIIGLNGQPVHYSDMLHCEFTMATAGMETGNHIIAITVEKTGFTPVTKALTIRLYVVNDQPCPCAPTVKDIDGNMYNTIQIGNQCWMRENLKVTRYADGTPLVDGTGAVNTQYDTITQYYFNYNDDSSFVETYGRLYIWMAAVNGQVSEADLNPSQVQGVCPDGWHVPSDSEWRQLEMFLGMPEAEAIDREWRGTIEGGMLKEAGTSHWKHPNAGATNESGFTALPAGHRTLNGDYWGLGTKGTFWTSTNHVAYNMTQNPAFRQLHNDESRIYRYRGFHGYLTYARSVRCVKD